ncbi:NAD(P)/FAD-dependent oxidoreductase [cf. Phormidesmis sp. LEGE 11477]|uniref:NAD(P)/FAD-dependent oxidoreductase n=1 Tax=cf. Phormidesmis sp. LEGE 11477 TaxID=1828680 RepID=UPI001881F5F2|nr:NAD(P)/FAD-dependent oxidoreductase [cf. Phormidesmis sp. LEGE 11477]MBE9063888.1 NAD(P)/FAD-dependent oxidoreductase [cf. Phormidesmis sp. LEGE 11477]
MKRRPRAVVIGAGFSGMQAAQSLSKSGADVLLIDRNNYNTFVPLLYQVAAAQIEPELIAYPVRTILRGAPRSQFLRAEVQRVDFADQVIEADSRRIPYDYLVMATGSRTQYLGVSGAVENAFPLRTLEQAIALRHHILQRLEQASQTSDPVLRQQLLTFVIVGGGPTGVEMAGTLTELKKAVKKDYPTLDLREMRIVIVQSGDTLLNNLPSRLGRYTARKLSRLNVEVMLNMRVSQVSAQTVTFAEGSCLPTTTVVWAAGLKAAVPEAAIALEQTDKQKVKVRDTLQLIDYDNVYAIGDLAYVQQQGKPLTGVAPEALQQGVAIARNIRRQIKGKDPQPFSYFNKGRLAIIGSYGGVGKIGPVLLTGFLPWLMWLGVHLVYLPGFRSRLLVLLSWLHSYGLGDRAIRLILSPSPLQRSIPPPQVSSSQVSHPQIAKFQQHPTKTPLV